ncbi:hypothetical protein [Exilibacterium tricleocarpae]|nr:hypothetical protein [Exilibacterium tricleocarpae]
MKKKQQTVKADCQKKASAKKLSAKQLLSIKGAEPRPPSQVIVER